MLWREVGTVELLAFEVELVQQIQISMSVKCHPYSCVQPFRSIGMVNTGRNLGDLRVFLWSVNSLYWLSISLHQLNSLFTYIEFL